MATITVDLTTLSNYNSLPDGTYTIKCVARGTGIYTPSNLSTGASTYRKGTYTISSAITNGSLTGDGTVRYGANATVTIVPNSNYTYPSSVSISGTVSSYTYNDTTGVITLNGVTSNVTVTAQCVLNSYSISASVNNATMTGDTSIVAGGTASVTIVPNQGYMLPTSLTSVTNASYTYNSTTGVVSLSNPTGNVLILGECISTQLTAPQISLSGSDLSITDVLDATSYDIYDGDTVIANVPVGGLPSGYNITLTNTHGTLDNDVGGYYYTTQNGSPIPIPNDTSWSISLTDISYLAVQGDSAAVFSEAYGRISGGNWETINIDIVTISDLTQYLGVYDEISVRFDG